MGKWHENVVEAFTYDAFYACFDASTPDDPDPTATYERDYEPFERLIADVLLRHGVPREATSFFDDWCPNRTRHVSCEDRHVSPRVLPALHALLRGRYEFWRIQFNLVDSVAEGDERGMLSLHREWVLCYGSARKLVDDVKRTEL